MSEETLSQRSRTIFGLVGAGVIAAAATFVAVGTTPSHEGSTYYNASFDRAGQGLDPGKSEVKIRGIAVGTVDELDLTDKGRVKVRFRLDEGVRVADTTTASIEPVSVFGPKDLVLDLGAHELSGPYLDDGGTVAKTEDPEELSDTAWPAYRLTKAINPDEVATILHIANNVLSLLVAGIYGVPSLEQAGDFAAADVVPFLIVIPLYGWLADRRAQRRELHTVLGGRASVSPWTLGVERVDHRSGRTE